MFHLKQFKVKNFKAFRESASVELKPLTVFAGVNSSGKSSFIQGMLLLKQSLERQQSPRLHLSGPEPGELFVEFATFEDVIFKYASPEHDRLGFELRVVSERMPQDTATGFFQGELPPPIESEFLSLYPLTLDVNIEFRYDENRGAIVDCIDCRTYCGSAIGPRLTTKTISDGRDQAIVTSAVNEHIKEAIQDLVWRSIFPVEATTPWIPDFSGKSRNILPEPDDDIKRELAPIFHSLNLLSKELTSRFYYVEALRPKPRPMYRIDPNPPLTISTQGDIVFQKLWYDRDKSVELIAPGQEREEQALSDVMNQVLSSLGIAHSLSIVPVGDVGFQVRCQTIDGEEKVSITNVGFGVSQVLPVLLMCLESEKDDTIIFEHPEIHLHPNAQAALADYFLELANSGRRLIVETHSQYFIKRLVRRVTERNELAEIINILFVRPPHGEKGATIAPLEVNADGDISNWPPDFFPGPDEDTAKTLEARFQRGQQ